MRTEGLLFIRHSRPAEPIQILAQNPMSTATTLTFTKVKSEQGSEEFPPEANDDEATATEEENEEEGSEEDLLNEEASEDEV